MTPKPSWKQRVPLVVGLSVATGFILFSSVYLPYFANLKNYRSEFEKKKLEEMERAKPSGGSTWKNIDSEIRKQ